MYIAYFHGGLLHYLASLNLYSRFRLFAFWHLHLLYLNHTAAPPLAIAHAHSRYVHSLFSRRRSVLTSFVEFVQPFSPFRLLAPALTISQLHGCAAFSDCTRTFQ